MNTQTNQSVTYRIVELNNKYWGDVAGIYGISLNNNYNSISDAEKALKEVDKKTDEEYSKYEYPYNTPPYRHYIVNNKTNKTVVS